MLGHHIIKTVGSTAPCQEIMPCCKCRWRLCRNETLCGEKSPGSAAAWLPALPPAFSLWLGSFCKWIWVCYDIQAIFFVVVLYQKTIKEYNCFGDKVEYQPIYPREDWWVQYRYWCFQKQNISHVNLKKHHSLYM